MSTVIAEKHTPTARSHQQPADAFSAETAWERTPTATISFVIQQGTSLAERSSRGRRARSLSPMPTEEESREFIASTDINFRPVYATTGPDGALYIIDMYRGMIQDAPWVNDQAKAFMRRSGLNFNIQNGRIYRITKSGIEQKRPPRLLDLPTRDLPTVPCK